MLKSLAVFITVLACTNFIPVEAKCKHPIRHSFNWALFVAIYPFQMIQQLAHHLPYELHLFREELDAEDSPTTDELIKGD